jgi:hypothetical protein
LKQIPLLLSLFLGLLIQGVFYAQSSETLIIAGNTTDIITGQAIEFVTIYREGTTAAVESNERGFYRITVPANEVISLVFTRIGYNRTSVELGPFPPNANKKYDIALTPTGSDLEVVVRASEFEYSSMIREDVRAFKLLPTTTGNLESILPSIALGTSSGTGGELSSQYNVRGGNFDENLIYVNDFEIYRPQLIRASQQEGLSFPNIDLIRDLAFSSGGFEANYGDKMSSVMDIRYKRPEQLKGSAELGFLGLSTHLEGSKRIGKNDYNKFRYLFGARYRSSRYLLNTLDVVGEYAPQFSDIQGYFTYDLNRDWQIAYMTNFNRSLYTLVPQERSTASGLFNYAIRLSAFFEGQEENEFNTFMNGVSLTYVPSKKKNPTYYKFMASTYTSLEDERFDIIGAYRLSQIETNFGSAQVGEDIAILGEGLQQNFVRNYLTLNVTNVEHRGGVEFQRNPEEGVETFFLQWGIKAQREDIQDNLNEWERLDSAGFSIPVKTESLEMYESLKSRNELVSYRFSGFLQNSYTRQIPGQYEMKFNFGIRATYWDLNRELNVSPRAQLTYKPLNIKKDIAWRLAAGLYQQPAFYRELRRLDGTLNTDISAQKSAQVLVGVTYDIPARAKGGVNLKVISEVYYKQLWDLISYDINNVRIRYSGENDARGYAMGWDLRVNGEFIQGAESWINFSFLRTREALLGVDHLARTPLNPAGEEIKDVPRPSDRLFNMSMFFQDYLPNNENFRSHVVLNIGTGLPFGFPEDNIVNRNSYRLRNYHRVDIGFSMLLWSEKMRELSSKNPFRFSNNAWLSLEIFNLMGVANESGKTWIKTYTGRNYAIPNFLTSRRVNLRIKCDF